MAARESVEKVAGRHFFEFSRVLPLAFAPGRQNPQGTKTQRFSSVLMCMPSEPEYSLRGSRPLTAPGFIDKLTSGPKGARLF